MKDLTKGKISTLILGFAIPVFLGNLLQLTYSLADTRIVGTFLGEQALAAVGATTTISNLIVGFLLGLANGFAIITAQKFGAGDTKRVRKSFAIAIILGAVISIVMILTGTIFINPILNFLNVPQELYAASKQYIIIIIVGLCVTMFYDILMAVMRAIGDTITPLLILAISVGLNIAGDILFVAIWKTGTWGAAAATVLAQFIALIICCFYMIHKYELLRLKKEDFENMESHMITGMLGSGMSMGFMSSLVNIGSLTLQTAINKLGQQIIVAHTAARKITEIYMIMFSVFGQTMATFCGQNMGARKVDRIKEGMKLAIIYTCVWSTFAMIASYTVGLQLVHMVTGSHKDVVIVNATNYLKFNTIFYYVPAVISIVRNVMQGIGDQITPLVSSGLEMVGKVVIAFTLVPLMGYAGVIIAEPIVWFIMVIPLIVQIIRTPKLKANK
nr:MATE family efflux transporter [uncultured Anaerostipes sp.]